MAPNPLRSVIAGAATAMVANRVIDWAAPEPVGPDEDGAEGLQADDEKAVRILGRPLTAEERERIANVVHVMTAGGVGLAWGWGRAQWPLLRGSGGTALALGAILLARGAADQAFGFTRGPRGFVGRVFFGTREPFRLLDGIGEIARV